MKSVTRLIVGVSLMACANPAMAAEWIYFNSGATQSGKGLTFTDGTVKVRATAWSTDQSKTIREANLGYWTDGLGVSYGVDNSHTVDNYNSTDFLLLQFDQAVTLNSGDFRTGWNYLYDTDATIRYANLDAAFTSDPNFKNKAAVSALKDFTSFASGSPGRSFNSVRNINPEGKLANTWIVSAGDTWSPDYYLDGFKLKGVSYTVPATPAVPEPATWAMLLLGFGAVGSVLRGRPARTRVTFA